ncbi:HU family DNA-binding protein [Mycoplasmoides pneumoniae]|uniref:Uncharacterized protein MG353 homolog n=4 Tax=Mycoplasmoides pneumoniae TaxID=2104 RepID=Y529_MYCPN|nr:HU family DNA-binding protein [Mycoplasmoides pneumoniae]P75249.1 RecName: Full=Uncharacterized protein MG353 homolog [Mycoplasmoides pneumoniae M129]AAB95961.1 bacterial histone-like protein [Mycoplasmoides pneumoniae M129]ADK86788.1 putative DNA-binding protein HU [Mycoplasmoides pneumoniae FH]AGC04415.1 hypothetical protein C985_0539 [Mycoplasmoides pneumoniae M129-B7]ALA30404.1 hypothetical protein C897_03045 [Mycoplasmoides pneumoniae PI 1428]ALA30690.1 hypothetical protein B434_00670
MEKTTTSSKPLSRSEINKIIAVATGVKEAKIKEIFKYLNTLLLNELVSRSVCILPENLGKLRITIRNARIQKDMKTGEMKHIPPKPLVRYSPSKTIKETAAKVRWKYAD